MKLLDFIIEKLYVLDRTQAKRFLYQNYVSVNGQQTDCWFQDLEKGDVVIVQTPKSFKVHPVN